jgi:hypothetical protein
MAGNASDIYPGWAGSIESVTGSLTVDTGFKKVRSFSVDLAEAASVASAQASGTLVPAANGENAKITLNVKQDDHATDSVTATDVAWMALEA